MKDLLIKTTLTSLLATTLLAGGGGDILRANFTADKFEYQNNSEESLYWDSYGYIGYDRNKIYIYSEGESTASQSISSENQLLFSHAVAPFWDLQAGIAYDTAQSTTQTWAVFALSGLAPYFFETRAALLVDEHANIGLRLDTEYEALLTQRLILTPRLRVDAYSKENPQMQLGSGVANVTLGARLRYEIRREFAPYIGIEWTKNFGKTGTYQALNESYASFGLRFWF